MISQRAHHGGTKVEACQCLYFASSALISCCPGRPLSGFSAFNAKQTLMEAGCCLAVAANTAKLL